MKTAEEIYEENGCQSKRDIIDAMQEYANYKLQEAAEKAIVKMDSGRNGCKMIVDKESILSLKDKV